ncbi:tripartite tricarboxylate transporter substrate binding protein [soil metagenome]
MTTTIHRGKQTFTVLASLATLAFSCLLPATASAADVYPSKPITIVVAYPAGGDSDVLARLFGEKLSQRMKQPVLVENRTGAGGNIGTSYVVKSKADGYTLLMAPNTVVISPLVIKSASVNYDVEKDLTPIAQIGVQPLFVVAATDTGVTNMKELVASAKAGKIQAYASPGNGSPMHILAEMFDRSAGIKLAQVPYRGSVPAVADMVGGHVPMMYSTLGPVAPFIEQKKLVALAVADTVRSPFLPNVPTLAESGFNGSEVGAWQALMGPKDMPAELVRTLNEEMNAIMKMPDVAARMTAMAVLPTGGEPAKLARLVASDNAKYTKVIADFGIHAD